jgi:maltooligosyltrehalose trehalohydrolase
VRPKAPIPLGAQLVADGVQFGLWAPAAEQVEVLVEATDSTEERRLALSSPEPGYFCGRLAAAGVGTLYRFCVDGGAPMPDPRSRSAPRGVFGPSCVVDPAAYAWQDTGWQGRPLRALVIYELHVGTFSPAGTFAGVQEKLPELQRLGINAIELMPVHDFPGRWNWGYDPGALFAPCRAYGSPDSLRRLVDAAHALGISVLLDVVYNHLGPDGAFAPAYCPYFFTERHHTAWGSAINFDGPHAGPIRDFFLDNACDWLVDFHIDGLRLDATAAIVDDSTPHLLAELSERVGRLDGPARLLIAEDSRNFAPLLAAPTAGGLGMDGVWVDDFHHQIRCALTGEQESYYQDYRTDLQEIPKTLATGWLYTGQPSRFLEKPRGTPAPSMRPEQAVYCIQNHDQVGNRAAGERLHHQIDLAAYRAASALLLWLPQTPMLFAGQEWAASTPFQFFTDHSTALGRQVTAGRRAEFKDFASFAGTVPDPQSPATFANSVLRWEERQQPTHAGILQLYADLLKQRPQFAHPSAPWTCVAQAEGLLIWQVDTHYLVILLRPAAQVEFPESTELVWHSEDVAYTPEPHPPDWHQGKEKNAWRLHCKTPLAAWLRRPSPGAAVVGPQILSVASR